jgi:hypothetical protein
MLRPGIDEGGVMRASRWTALLLGIMLTHTSWAQDGTPTRFRGKIASVAAHSITVTERSGKTVQIDLDEPLSVSTVKPVALSSIAPGSFIGTAARKAADGSLEALEVLVFPEAMRGAGEGNRPWDLEPQSTMINATVTGVVEQNSGRDLTLTYKDGSSKVLVPPNVPVVTFAPADRADLKPGASVFLTAMSNAQGKWHTGRITVGTGGVAPPM